MGSVYVWTGRRQQGRRLRRRPLGASVFDQSRQTPILVYTGPWQPVPGLGPPWCNVYPTWLTFCVDVRMEPPWPLGDRNVDLLLTFSLDPWAHLPERAQHHRDRRRLLEAFAATFNLLTHAPPQVLLHI